MSSRPVNNLPPQHNYSNDMQKLLFLTQTSTWIVFLYSSAWLIILAAHRVLLNEHRDDFTNYILLKGFRFFFFYYYYFKLMKVNFICVAFLQVRV